jgi:hypothetical protein
MTCITLKSGIRLNVAKEAWQSESYRKALQDGTMEERILSSFKNFQPSKSKKQSEKTEK